MVSGGARTREPGENVAPRSRSGQLDSVLYAFMATYDAHRAGLSTGWRCRCGARGCA